MNYRYNFIGKDYIVSSDEHKYILDQRAKDVTEIWLRGGRLGISIPHGMAFMVNETDEMTAIEEEQKHALFKLTESKRTLEQERETGKKFLSKSHSEFYKHMGWPK